VAAIRCIILHTAIYTRSICLKWLRFTMWETR